MFRISKEMPDRILLTKLINLAVRAKFFFRNKFSYLISGLGEIVSNSFSMRVNMNLLMFSRKQQKTVQKLPSYQRNFR